MAQVNFSSRQLALGTPPASPIGHIFVSANSDAGRQKQQIMPTRQNACEAVLAPTKRHMTYTFRVCTTYSFFLENKNK
jgi:hypothetical protein